MAEVISSPDGKRTFHIGQRVGIWNAASYREAVIADYHPGSWEPSVPNDETAWFDLDDGSMARPYLLIDAESELGDIARAFAPRYAQAKIDQLVNECNG